MRPLRFAPLLPTARASWRGRLRSSIVLLRAAQPTRRAAVADPAPDPLARTGTRLRQAFGDGDWSLARDAHGRPQLREPSALDLSISHSGAVWLAAVSRGRRIGVDIEAPRALPRVLPLAERYFSAEEAALLARLAPALRERAFLRLWCAREALLKAHGRGIAFGLQRLRFELTPRTLRLRDCDPLLGPARSWRLREFAPAPGMLGVLAWQGPPARLRGLALPETSA